MSLLKTEIIAAMNLYQQRNFRRPDFMIMSPYIHDLLFSDPDVGSELEIVRNPGKPVYYQWMGMRLFASTDADGYAVAHVGWVS